MAAQCPRCKRRARGFSSAPRRSGRRRRRGARQRGGGLCALARAGGLGAGQAGVRFVRGYDYRRELGRAAPLGVPRAQVYHRRCKPRFLHHDCRAHDGIHPGPSLEPQSVPANGQAGGPWPRCCEAASRHRAEEAEERDGMGWDGMGWDGMGWDGMGWDGMGWDGCYEDTIRRLGRNESARSPTRRGTLDAAWCNLTMLLAAGRMRVRPGRRGTSLRRAAVD